MNLHLNELMARCLTFSLAVAMLPTGAALLAQTSGSLEGLVLDASRVPIAGAALLVKETGTNAERRLSTDSRGRFLVPGLAPGHYRVEAAHPGFRSKILRDIELTTGRAVWLEAVLELGELRESIEVTAEAQLLSTRADDWGASVEKRALESLPLNGRDLFNLTAQQPGVMSPSSSRNGPMTGTGVHVSVNGARANQNSFRLDGVYIGDWTSSAPASISGNLLGVEAIEEIRVVTSPFSAVYGRAAGAPITAVSKSGSNAFHGSLYEYLRNSALDAKNFFDLADSKIPPLRKNQFGAAQSGPVVHDKLFYFLNYEGIRQTASRTVSPVTITEEARQGRLPLAGGGLRTVQVAPAILPYLDLFPLPNGRDFGDGTAEYINESVTPTREDYLSGKGDVIFSDRLRVGAHYTFDDSVTTSPDPFQVWQFDSDSRHHFIHTDTRMIHSPSTSSSIGAAFSRIGYADTSRQRASISPSLSFVEGRPLGGIQVVGLSDFGGLNVQLRPRTFLMDDTQVNYQLTHLRGAHAIQFGAGFDRVRLDQMSDNNANGRYRFTSLLNFLEGRPQSGDLMVPGSDTKRTWRQAQFHAFVQDEYRVGPRLSISVGVRYEAYSVPVEQDNKIATLPQPWTDPAVTTGAPLFVNPSKRNFAPRASIALDPWGGGRTVLRAGAGIFFDLLGARELAVAGLRMPPFFLRVTPANPAFPNLLAAAAGASPANSLDGLEYYVHQPYVSQYQFAVQHQVGSDVVLELGYAGARGVHLPGKLGNINSSSPTRLADGRVFFPAGAPRINPAFGPIGMRLMQFNSFYHGLNASMRRRWKGGFTGQAKYTWSKSIDEVSSATFDDYVNSDGMPMIFDYRQNRGPSDFDLRHVFAVSFSWEIPSPRRGGVWRHLGGWGLYGVGRLQSGHPFNPSVGFDRAGLRPATGDLGQRPDFAAAPGSPLVLGNPQRYFDTTAFALPDRGFYGNLGRNVLTGPGMVSLDLALHKTLWSTERQSVRLRLEAFNIANRPNFQLPSDLGLFNSSGQRVGSAGRISSTTTTSRQIQIALRWMF